MLTKDESIKEEILLLQIQINDLLSLLSTLDKRKAIRGRTKVEFQLRLRQLKERYKQIINMEEEI